MKRTWLVACLLAATAVGQSGADEVARVREELKTARANKELANDKEERGKLALAWIDVLWKAAEAAPDAEQRWTALILAQESAEFGQGKQCEDWRAKLRTKILSEHADDVAKMSQLMRASPSEATRKAIFDKTKSAAVKANCLWAEAAPLIAQTRGDKLDKAGRKQLDELLAKLRKDYADELDSQGRRWADVVDGRLRAMNDLMVGKPAPEIEGKDLDGTPFKLSDYRGKVVVLDFWGNW